MHQQRKALISANQLFVKNNLQGVFPTMIGLVTLGPLLFVRDHAKKVAKVDKANHGWENTL